MHIPALLSPPCSSVLIFPQFPQSFKSFFSYMLFSVTTLLSLSSFLFFYMFKEERKESLVQWFPLSTLSQAPIFPLKHTFLYLSFPFVICPPSNNLSFYTNTRFLHALYPNPLMSSKFTTYAYRCMLSFPPYISFFPFYYSLAINFDSSHTNTHSCTALTLSFLPLSISSTFSICMFIPALPSLLYTSFFPVFYPSFNNLDFPHTKTHSPAFIPPYTPFLTFFLVFTLP